LFASRKANPENSIDPADGLLSPPGPHVHPEESTPSLEKQERTTPRVRGSGLFQHKPTVATIVGLYLLGNRLNAL
jgi:hypothetical protein